MLMTASTMGMVHGVHGHTTDSREHGCSRAIEMEMLSCLEDGLDLPAAPGKFPYGRPAFGVQGFECA